MSKWVGIFFQLYRGGRRRSVVMSGPDKGIAGQGVDLFMNGVDQLLPGPAGQIGSADRPDKQCIAGKNMALGVEAYTSRRVPGGMKYG